jgi:hypothetical protein
MPFCAKKPDRSNFGSTSSEIIPGEIACPGVIKPTACVPYYCAEDVKNCACTSCKKIAPVALLSTGFCCYSSPEKLWFSEGRFWYKLWKDGYYTFTPAAASPLSAVRKALARRSSATISPYPPVETFLFWLSVFSCWGLIFLLPYCCCCCCCDLNGSTIIISLPPPEILTS